jgi:hypothetical protein
MANLYRFPDQHDLFRDEVDSGVAADDEAAGRRRLGRYAEFMVCAELTKLGYDVWHCDAPGFDVVLVEGDRSLRIQVRSTGNIDKGYCSWMCRKGYGSRDSNNFLKSRILDRRDADLIALYHLVFGSLIFATVDELPGGGTFKFPVGQVREHDCSGSLLRALARLE